MKILILPFLLILYPALGQQRAFLPNEIDPKDKYLFYFHGGIVTVAGDNAINPSRPEWGRYEYSNILEALRNRGFTVISEIRKEGVDDAVYVDKLVSQIDTLLQKEVPAQNILVLGASAGNEIVLHSASQLKNTTLRFAITGGCWPDTHKAYTAIPLYGHFLSVIESSDPHGTCSQVFKRRQVSSFREIKLKTGLSHGFLYRGLKEWIDPVVMWFSTVEPDNQKL